MSQNIGFISLPFLFIIHFTAVKSTNEGTLACVKIQGTYQWAVYLKCYGTNKKLCWYGCQLPESHSKIQTVQRDCRCDPVEEQRQKRFFPFLHSYKIPEVCFNPNGENKSWFHTCILDKRPSLIKNAIIGTFNNVLQMERSIQNLKPFFKLLKTKLKPAICKIFRNKSSDADLESRINKYFKLTISSRYFPCNMFEKDKTLNLHKGILNVISQLRVEEFEYIFRRRKCLLNENILHFQRFAVVSTKRCRRRKIIQKITRDWRDSHRIVYIQVDRDRATEVFAWNVDFSRDSEKLYNITVENIHKFFIDNSKDDSRAFIKDQGKGTRYCTYDIGCIRLSMPYKDVMENTKEKIPESLNEMKVQFWRYMNISQSKPVIDHIQSDIQCLEKQTLFYIIHGFTDSGEKDWVFNMKNALLKRQPNCLVVVVDWEEGAHTFLKSNYYQAAVNTYAVGGIVAHAITKHYTERGCFKPEDIHIIGHSLGAQTAGFAGHTFRIVSGQILGRITGLDPAGPFFGEKATNLRLDETDAKYVEVLHTNARKGDKVLSAIGSGLSLKFGVKYPAGHIDFYVNGGVRQPFCLTFGCSHSRAYAYFTESITSSDCMFIGFRCSGDDDETRVNNCIKKENYDLDKRAIMGFNESKTEVMGIYYVETTGNKKAFCNGTISSNYQINK